MSEKLPPELTSCLSAKFEDDKHVDPNDNQAVEQLVAGALAASPPQAKLCDEAMAVIEILGPAGAQQFLGLLLLKGFMVTRCDEEDRALVAKIMATKKKTVIHNAPRLRIIKPND